MKENTFAKSLYHNYCISNQQRSSLETDFCIEIRILSALLLLTGATALWQGLYYYPYLSIFFTPLWVSHLREGRSGMWKLFNLPQCCTIAKFPSPYHLYLVDRNKPINLFIQKIFKCFLYTAGPGDLHQWEKQKRWVVNCLTTQKQKMCAVIWAYARFVYYITFHP